MRRVSVVEEVADAGEPLAAHGARVVGHGGGIVIIVDIVDSPKDIYIYIKPVLSYFFTN